MANTDRNGERQENKGKTDTREAEGTNVKTSSPVHRPVGPCLRTTTPRDAVSRLVFTVAHLSGFGDLPLMKRVTEEGQEEGQHDLYYISVPDYKAGARKGWDMEVCQCSVGCVCLYVHV